MENCGNSCYIDSVIFAMFHDGMNESYDGILVQDLKDDKTSAVQRILRDVVVTQLRRREAVKAPDMSKLRLALNLCGWEGFAVGSGGNEDVRRLVEMGFSHQHAVLSLIANDGKVDSAISQLLSRDPGMDTEIDKSIMSKYRQQDALEFLQFFLDLLKAPRIPFSQRILKNMGGSAPAAKSSTDMKYVTDRAVLLNLVQQPKNLFATSRNAVRLEDLLRRHFYDDQIEVAGASSQSKSVLKVLKLSPFYTNDCEIDGCTYNGEASLFPNFIIPIVLLRYGYNSSASKNSCPVAFPETLDVSRYIDKDSSLPLPEYMLVLRSLVLHVGDRANEGHYVSIGRNSEIFDGAGGWVLHDDLKKPVRPLPAWKKLQDLCQERKLSLEKDTYILFYQLQHRTAAYTDEELAKQIARYERQRRLKDENICSVS